MRRRRALAAEVLGDEVWQKLPMQAGTRAVADSNAELILNRTWRPALAITGAEGLPPIAQRGNVMRPVTRLRLSLRVPPRLDAKQAATRVKAVLESDPPYGAQVSFKRQRREQWLGCAAAGTLAGECVGECIEAALWSACDVSGRGRVDSVHGHAR